MWLLDAAGRASSRPLVRLAILVLLLTRIHNSHAQSEADLTANIQQLLANQQWQEVVRIVNRSSEERTPETNYVYGTALAKLGRWQEAYSAFLLGYRAKPSDQRFAIELAGVRFKQKKYSDAKTWLRRALRRDPNNSYANDFLGTIYYLEGNLDASLKYWNRVGKPKITRVGLDPQPSLNTILLDRAFAVSPASVLGLGELRTTETRLRGLGVFPSINLQLAAQNDGTFTLTAHAREKDGWGATKLQGLVSLMRGVFQQTVYPEYFNFNHSAVNLESMVRWDSEKRRVRASLSGPVRRDAKLRYRFNADLRNENWSYRSLSSGSLPLGGLNLRREAVSAAITSFSSCDFSWSSAVELSHRDFRNVVPGPAITQGFLLQGFQLKHSADFNYQLWRRPENRFTTSAMFSSEIARIWSQPSHSFVKVQGGLSGHWFPKSRGDDYETTASIRVGRAFGTTPVDELFALGVERDNDLWLRGHAGTYRGRKGSGAIGTSYLLQNVNFDKSVYGNGIFSVKVGPFLDMGKMLGYSLNTDRREWLVDSGLQSKVHVLGVGLIFVYGRDLRSGRNTLYATTER